MTTAWLAAPAGVSSAEPRLEGGPGYRSGAGEAAVDVDGLPRDVVAGGGREEDGDAGEVGRLAVPAHVRPVGQRGRPDGIGRHLHGQRGGHETWAHRVNAHPGGGP